jgi:hypothetical protein
MAVEVLTRLEALTHPDIRQKMQEISPGDQESLVNVSLDAYASKFVRSIRKHFLGSTQPLESDSEKENLPEIVISKYLYKLVNIAVNTKNSYELRFQALGTLKAGMDLIHRAHVFPPTSDFLMFKMTIDSLTIDHLPPDSSK